MRDYENEVSMENLSYELEIMLQAMLINAGVKRDKLEKACELYVENIDDVLDTLDENISGVDEILAVVKFLKEKHKELFN